MLSFHDCSLLKFLWEDKSHRFTKGSKHDVTFKAFSWYIFTSGAEKSSKLHTRFLRFNTFDTNFSQKIKSESQK